MCDSIQKALARGAVALTDGEGPARNLRRALRQSVVAAETAAAREPAVLPLERWMQELWGALVLEGLETRVLLNRVQEHALWRRAIDADLLASGLLARDALARTASRAGWLGARFGVSRAGDRAGDQTGARGAATRSGGFSLDEQAWLRWAATVERHCERGAFLLASGVPAALTRAVERETSRHQPLFSGDLGRELCLVDVEELPPAIEGLLQAFAKRGTPIERLTSTLARPAGRLLAAEDDQTELQAAMHWARDRALREPHGRIALVLPDLGARRAEIERVVRKVFDPDALGSPDALDSAARSAVPWAEITTGVPVAESGPGHAALLLLRWMLRPLTLDEVSALLLSPWFGSPRAAGEAKDLAAAAEFDVFILRREKLLRPALAFSDFRQLLERTPHAPALEPLRRRVRALGDAAEREGLMAGGSRGRAASARRSTGDRNFPGWIEAFRRVLDTCGWYAAVSADPRAAAAREAFDRALDTVATLSFAGSGPEPVTAVVDALARVAGETPQRSRAEEARVQILAAGEIGGAPFDALWLLGLDDRAWPPAVAIDPLLPLAWQRRAAMPGTDGGADERRARRLLERLAGAAPEVVFSFSRTTGRGGGADGVARDLAPMVEDLQLEPYSLATPDVSQPWPTPIALEDRMPGPRLGEGALSGGVTVLKLQAACPFRAFAERRLSAGVPEEREPGLDPRDRGTLLHRALERFWAELGEGSAGSSQAELEAIVRAGELAPRLRSAIDRALPDADQVAHLAGDSLWNAAYFDIERERLERLLTAWLRFELKRKPFTVVAGEQAERSARIGPLALSLRIDRIDRTEKGLLVVDYKTSKITPAAWMSDRPDEPQLPLYAVLEDGAMHDGAVLEDRTMHEDRAVPDDGAEPAGAPAESLAGVAFAIVRAGDLKLTGIGVQDGPLEKSEKMDAGTFSAQLAEWRRVLAGLATAFSEGDARVDPKSYPTTCKHCEQRILCRLDPESLFRESEYLDEDGLEQLDQLDASSLADAGGLDG